MDSRIGFGLQWKIEEEDFHQSVIGQKIKVKEKERSFKSGL